MESASAAPDAAPASGATHVLARVHTGMNRQVLADALQPAIKLPGAATLIAKMKRSLDCRIDQPAVSPVSRRRPIAVQAAEPLSPVPGLRQFLFVTTSATWIE